MLRARPSGRHRRGTPMVSSRPMTRILLVDTSASDRLAIARMFKALVDADTCALDAAASFGSAALLLALGDYDVVLANLELDGHSAVELFRVNADSRPRPPMILMSGQSLAPIDLPAADAAVVDVLLKAELSIDGLRRTLERALTQGPAAAGPGNSLPAREDADANTIQMAWRASESTLHEVLNELEDGVLLVAVDDRILFANAHASWLLGLASELPPLARLPPELIDAPGNPVALTDARGMVHSVELKYSVGEWLGQTVRILTLRDSGSARFDPQPATAPLLGDDARPPNWPSWQSEFEIARAQLASHDAVTGLRRQSTAGVPLQSLLGQARVEQQRLLVVFVNLDRFGLINDTLGFAVGDAALRQVAERLSHAAGKSGLALHHAGNEFLLAIPGVAVDADLQALANSFCQAIAAPMTINEAQLYLTASIGAAAFPASGDSISKLARQAEFASRRARQGGRNLAVVFGPEMLESMETRQLLGGRLHEALRRGEFCLHYQPQVNAQDGTLVGLEALIRWDSPEFGQMRPASFIPIAEDSGLILQIGAWVLRQACAQIRQWQDAGFEHFVVSVNVSAVQMQHGDFVELVRRTISEFGIAPEMLELELTESTFLDNATLAVEQLRALKQIGLRLSLDDFGTGYSSLSYLRLFPLDKLKIDQSFIADITSEGTDAALVRTMIAVGHQLGMRVIAEGVETEAQCSYLRRHHCDEFQGHFFSPAVAPERVPELFARMQVAAGDNAAKESGRCLLIVDDDDYVRRSLLRLLRRDGYRILEANSAAAAFELLATEEVQVILSDQRMPGMNGTEFLSRAKTIYPDTIRIVLSGFTELSSVTGAVNRGAIYKFLTKPWDDTEMRAHIADAFSRHELARGAAESTRHPPQPVARSPD